jgi:hypothetical protein
LIVPYSLRQYCSYPTVDFRINIGHRLKQETFLFLDSVYLVTSSLHRMRPILVAVKIRRMLLLYWETVR